MDVFLWVVIPYAALASFGLGHAWRWRHDRWEAGLRSGRRAVRTGARWEMRLIHLGVAAMLVDVVSLLVPRADAGGAPELRLAGLALGIAGATAMTVGLVALTVRGQRGRGGARRRPGPMDWVTIGMLLTVLSFGLWEAVGINAILAPHDNGLTIGRWVRDLLTLHPDSSGMAAATVDDRWHVELIVLLVGVWPYTHLVHAWHAVAEAVVARRPGGRGRVAATLRAGLGSPPAR